YTSYLQFTYPSTMVLVRMDERAGASLASLRAAIGAAGGGFVVYNVRTLDERMADTLSRPRYNTTILTAFAAAALFLAAVGVYGVMSCLVSARTREMGVRLALGADPGRLVRLWLTEGVQLASAGAAIGCAAALGLMRVARSVLAGVTGPDPLVFAIVPAI